MLYSQTEGGLNSIGIGRLGMARNRRTQKPRHQGRVLRYVGKLTQARKGSLVAGFVFPYKPHQHYKLMLATMKNILMFGTLALVLVPQFSFAAPLTPTQAESLINVVQSSPGTPASAFINLIIAFSNITTAQANSLIEVIQAAPGTSANVFVNLLTSFTVDVTPAPIIQTAPINVAPAPQTTPSTAITSTTQTPPIVTTPPSQARIDIIDPIAGKGIHNRSSQISTSTDFDERGQPMNEVVIGAVVYGADGQPVGDVRVIVTTTDPSQNKTYGGIGETQYPTYGGTGTITPIYVNGGLRFVPVYMFTYEVRQAGPNEIAFSALGLTKAAGFTAK